jgi:hypothetical protein
MTVMHDINVNAVSAEEASLGVAEFWSGPPRKALLR